MFCFCNRASTRSVQAHPATRPSLVSPKSQDELKNSETEGDEGHNRNNTENNFMAAAHFGSAVALAREEAPSHANRQATSVRPIGDWT